MSSATYIPYYKKKIGEYTELEYLSKDETKKAKYRKELNVLTEGLSNLEKQEAVS